MKGSRASVLVVLKLCIDLLSVYLGVNVVAVVDVNYPCSFRADYDVLGWFHELLKHESDEQLCGEMQTKSHLYSYDLIVVT
jgi:hypothetical protein